MSVWPGICFLSLTRGHRHTSSLRHTRPRRAGQRYWPVVGASAASLPHATPRVRAFPTGWNATGHQPWGESRWNSLFQSETGTRARAHAQMKPLPQLNSRVLRRRTPRRRHETIEHDLDGCTDLSYVHTLPAPSPADRISAPWTASASRTFIPRLLGRAHCADSRGQPPIHSPLPTLASGS